MPAKYHSVSPNVWDRSFRQLSAEAKIVAFNVWTSRQRASEGLFTLSPGHIAADTGLSVDQVEAALPGLDELIGYDADAEVVLDRLALRTNPLRNGVDKATGEVRPDNRIKAAVSIFEQVPESPLKGEFLILADQFSPDLAAAIRESPTFKQAPSKALPRGSEGASREESSRDEKSGVREEQQQCSCPGNTCHCVAGKLPYSGEPF